MRLGTFLFAAMLAMGISFGGASLISSQTAFAESHDTEDAAEGEIPGGEMTDDAEGAMDSAQDAMDKAEDTKDMVEDATEGELPGAEMENEAEGNEEAAEVEDVETPEGEMPGTEMENEAEQ